VECALTAQCTTVTDSKVRHSRNAAAVDAGAAAPGDLLGKEENVEYKNI